jgi:hypothetical protein
MGLEVDQVNLKSCTTDIVSLIYWGGSSSTKCSNPVLEIKVWKSYRIPAALIKSEKG